MTIKEFKLEVNKLDLYVEKFDELLIIKKSTTGFGGHVSKVSENELYSFSTFFKDFQNLEEDVKEKLISLILDYSSTPINCREYKDGSDKYYLKLSLNGLVMQNSHVSYLNEFKSLSSNAKNKYSIGNNIESKSYKTKFTQEEIDNIPNDIICCFEKILVEDE